MLTGLLTHMSHERKRESPARVRQREKRAEKEGKGKKRRYGIRVAAMREKRGLPFDPANARIYSEVIPTKV